MGAGEAPERRALGARSGSAPRSLGALGLASRARFAAEGPAALVHGNRGRVSGRRVDGTVRRREVERARTTDAGANETHLAELLAEHEGITLSRVTVRRILRAGPMGQVPACV